MFVDSGTIKLVDPPSFVKPESLQRTVRQNSYATFGQYRGGETCFIRGVRLHYDNVGKEATPVRSSSTRRNSTGTEDGQEEAVAFVPSDPHTRILNMVKSAVHQYTTKYATLPNCVLPNLFEAHIWSDGEHVELLMMNQRLGTARTIRDYYELWISKRKGISKAEVERGLAYIIREVLKLLNHLHQRKLIHGAVKVSNLLVTSLDSAIPLQLYLVDPGLYVLREAFGGKALQLITADYVPPPETTMEGKTPDSPPSPQHHFGSSSSFMSIPETNTPAADVWGLGISLLELVEGQPPSLRCALPPMLSVAGDWSPAFRAFAVKLVTLDPQNRPSVSELLADPFLSPASAMGCIDDALLGQSSRPNVSTTKDVPLAEAPEGIHEVINTAVGDKEFVRVVPNMQAEADDDANASSSDDEKAQEEVDMLPKRMGPMLGSRVILQALHDIAKDQTGKTELTGDLRAISAALIQLENTNSVACDVLVLSLLDAMASSSDSGDLQERAEYLRATLGLEEQEQHSPAPVRAVHSGSSAYTPAAKVDLNSYLYAKWNAIAAATLSKTSAVNHPATQDKGVLGAKTVG